MSPTLSLPFFNVWRLQPQIIGPKLVTVDENQNYAVDSPALAEGAVRELEAELDDLRHQRESDTRYKLEFGKWFPYNVIQ